MVSHFKRDGAANLHPMPSFIGETSAYEPNDVTNDDYECHPLLTDIWVTEGAADYAYVKRAHVATVDRNLAAIEVMARMLANSAIEPNASGGIPLDPWTTTRLLGGIESLCDYSRMMTEEMCPEPDRHAHHEST